MKPAHPSTLPPKWRQWLKNVLPSASPEKVCETLVNEGFTAKQITTAMGKYFPLHIKLPDDDKFYLQHATPAVLNNTNCKSICCDLPIYSIDNVFTPAECKTIVDLTSGMLTPSKIMVPQEKEYQDYRTSRTCYLHQTKHPFIDNIEDRIWSLVAPQRGGGETIQAQHYSEGEYYKPHHDFFAPGTESFKRSGREGGQRNWTCMIYISCPEKGGATHFLEPNLVVEPVPGKAILWNNLHSDGTPNYALRHQALPVEKGEKLVLTKWFRTRKHHQNQRISNKGKRTTKPVAHFLKK